jgi:hypothetical protein
MSVIDYSFHTLCLSPIGAGARQHSPTRQGHLEATWRNEDRYVNVYSCALKTAQSSLADSSFHFAFFQLLVQGHPLDSPTRQGNLEATLRNEDMYLNVYYCVFRTTQSSFADSSFHFAFFHLLVQGPSTLSNQARAPVSDTGKRK